MVLWGPLGMPFGCYTSISAFCLGSPTLWYTQDGSWSATESDKFIFQQTDVAVHSAIKNLPAGYHTKVNFETVPIVYPDDYNSDDDINQCLC